MSLLSAFNTQVENFLTELTEMYPDDKDLAFGKTSVYLLKKTNPRHIHSLFYNYAYPYKEKVLRKDESFFLEKDESKYFYSEESRKNYFSTILNLKKYWKGMSTESKEQIWTYFLVLFKLSDKLIESS